MVRLVEDKSSLSAFDTQSCRLFLVSNFLSLPASDFANDRFSFIQKIFRLVKKIVCIVEFLESKMFVSEIKIKCVKN